MHVMIEMDDKSIAAVPFMPKSGGRVLGDRGIVLRLSGPGTTLSDQDGTAALDELERWPSQDWSLVYGVWARPELYAMYGGLGRRPPWGPTRMRDLSTVYWLLGDPPSVCTGEGTDLAAQVVRQICQLQMALMNVTGERQ